MIKNRCPEDNYGSKYLTLIPTNKNKDVLEKNEEIWNKIKDPIKLKNNSEDYKGKYMKIRINSDDYLSLRITLKCKT